MSGISKWIAALVVVAASIFGFRTLTANTAAECCCGSSCACEVCNCDGDTCVDCSCEGCGCDACGCDGSCPVDAKAAE